MMNDDEEIASYGPQYSLFFADGAAGRRSPGVESPSSPPPASSTQAPKRPQIQARKGLQDPRAGAPLRLLRSLRGNGSDLRRIYSHLRRPRATQNGQGERGWMMFHVPNALAFVYVGVMTRLVFLHE